MITKTGHFKTKKTGLEINIPNSWNEISWSDGFYLLAHGGEMTDIALLSFLSGISIEKLRQETDIESIHYLIHSLTFLADYPSFDKASFPREYGGTSLPWIDKYDIFDLGGCSVGQVEDMRMIITQANAQSDLEVVQLYPQICAIYLQPIFYGPAYDFDKAKLMSEVIQYDSFLPVYNMGAFFLKKLSGLPTGLQSVKRSRFSVRTRLRRALRNLRKLLDSI